MGTARQLKHPGGGNAQSVAGCAIWITGSVGAVYAVLHSDGQSASTGVLIVPPFGWDEVESHRARRYWAVRLAKAGLPCLRFDLPGTGDSEGGPRDPNLLDRWTASIDSAASWLRYTLGVDRVAVIGIGVGGLVASRAISEGAAVDDLVLWGTRASGRQAVREIRAYAGVVASKHPHDHEGHEVEDGIEVTGFLLAGETQRALSACNVEEMDFPHRGRLRVLLLSRDSLPVDLGLERAFERGGAAVTSVETRDYHHLVAHPQSLVLRRPESTIALSITWLRYGAADQLAGQTTSPASEVGSPRGEADFAQVVTSSVELQNGGQVIRETIIDIDVGGQPGYAIITEPTQGERAPVASLLLSSGAIRKIGQHRMWVELARRWAARGVITVRFDLPGIGDTAGDAGAKGSATVNLSALHAPETVEAVTGVLVQLRDRGIAQRFVTVGHCSGAYLGLHAAITDPGVVGYFGIDQQIFEYTEATYQGQMLELIRAALRDGLVTRLRERGVTAHEKAQVRDAILFRLRSGRARGTRASRSPEQILDRLAGHGTDMLLLLVQEPGLFALMPEGDVESWAARWPNLVIEELPTEDHMARALWLQQLTHERLDAGLERLLCRLTATGVPSTVA
jgi:alpha-beta hydrolase superfamily lysophospholipase